MLGLVVMASIAALVHCMFDSKISWITAVNVTIMTFVYGFPYMLSVPSIWDIALVQASRQLQVNSVNVLNHDAIPKAASLDYLAL